MSRRRYTFTESHTSTGRPKRSAASTPSASLPAAVGPQIAIARGSARPGSGVAITIARLAPDELGRAPALDPRDALERLATLDELGDFSRRDLRILRNTVYARRGRAFKSPFLQAWFDDKDWYQVDPDFKESRLSSVDRKNIRLIRSVEDSLGGPMSDREQRAEDDAWAGEA